MALSPQAISNLNIASQRIAQGRGSAADIRNVDYAKKQGYTYNAGTPTTTSAPMEVQPTIGASPADSVSQILSGLAVAVGRQKQGRASKQDLASIAYAQKTYGFDPITMTLKKGPNVKTAIPADQLGAGDPYRQISDILGANVTPDMLNSDMAGILALNNANSSEKKQYDELTGQLTDLNKQLADQAGDFQTEMDKQGVGQAYQQIKELNLKAAQLQGEIGQFDAETEKINANLGEQAIPTGLIQGQQAQLDQQRTLAHNSKVAELSAVTALNQAYQGNANLGLELAQKAVDLKYAPMLQQIETLKTQIGFAKENMSAADAKRADIINAIADERKTRLTDQKNNENAVQNILIEAAANGAPLAEINSLKNSDPATAASKLSQYLTSTINRRTSGSGGSGTKPLAETYSLTSAQEQKLIGAGLSTEDIQNIQDNIRNGNTVNDILNIPGLSDEQKKIIGGTFNVPEKQFLDEKFLRSEFNYEAALVKDYGGYGSKKLKAAAKKAKYGGFFGVSTDKQKSFIKSEGDKYIKDLNTKVAAYRKAGYTDQEILKLVK